MRSPRDWLKDVALEGCRLLAGPRGAVRAILMYHSVGSAWGVASRSFEDQISYLHDNFQLVRLRDLLNRITIDEPTVCLTFDDGYLDNYERALAVLDRFSINATFFIASSYIGGTFRNSMGEFRMMNSQQIRDLALQGHEIGAHTIAHPKLTSISIGRARQEIVDGRKVLEEMLGGPVVSFAYPKGDYNDAVKDLVRDAGFRSAVTTREGLIDENSDWLALPRVSVSRVVGKLQFRAKLSPGLELYERIKRRA